VSYINIHKVETELTPAEQLRVPDLGDHNLVTSRREGEEISAAAKLLSLLDDLAEGEALVVWRDIF
jgi:hypothetical protein